MGYELGGMVNFISAVARATRINELTIIDSRKNSMILCAGNLEFEYLYHPDFCFLIIVSFFLFLVS